MIVDTMKSIHLFLKLIKYGIEKSIYEEKDGLKNKIKKDIRRREQPTCGAACGQVVIQRRHRPQTAKLFAPHFTIDRKLNLKVTILED